MMRYKTRKGVILTEICGEQLLVAAHSLKDICPFVTVVNETSAFLWKRLQNGASAGDLEHAVMQEFEVEDPSAICGLIETFLRQMLEIHYIIAESGE